MAALRIAAARAQRAERLLAVNARRATSLSDRRTGHPNSLASGGQLDAMLRQVGDTRRSNVRSGDSVPQRRIRGKQSIASWQLEDTAKPSCFWR